jgi:hypothetical protein
MECSGTLEPTVNRANGITCFRARSLLASLAQALDNGDLQLLALSGGAFAEDRK